MQLTDPVTAIVLSVTVVLVFGEIIPQAVCSRYGDHPPTFPAYTQLPLTRVFKCAPIYSQLKRKCCAGLAVGSYSAWFVRILMFLCFPVGERTCCCRTL